MTASGCFKRVVGFFLTIAALFAAYSFTVTRIINNELVRQVFKEGDSVAVLVGGGVFLTAVILGVAHRGRIRVKFLGGEKGVVRKDAVYKQPPGSKKVK